MPALRGLAILLLVQAAGELLARAFGLPFPGPVIGLALLFGALALPALRAPVQAAAEPLLANLSLLFVPVGVGVVAHLDLLGAYGLRLAVVIVASTLVTLAVTAWMLARLLRSAGAADDAARRHG